MSNPYQHYHIILYYIFQIRALYVRTYLRTCIYVIIYFYLEM